MTKTLLILFALSFCEPIFAMNQKEKNTIPTECIICNDALFNSGQDVVILQCHETHAYHFACINKWNQLKPTCPNCRANLCSKNAERLFDHIGKPTPRQNRSLCFSILACFMRTD